MPTQIALLRAINLASRNRVAMAKLRALAEALGLEEPRTLLQSGNLVFESSGRAAPKLESLLEKTLKHELGIETDFFVRATGDWKKVIVENPFRNEAKRDPGHLLVVFLKKPPSAAAVRALENAIVGRERVRVKGRHAYIHYADGIGRSKLTSAVIEKKLETRGTGRNWNTVLKLAAMAGLRPLKSPS